MTTYRDTTKTVIVALIKTQAGWRCFNYKESRSSQYVDVIYKDTESFGYKCKKHVIFLYPWSPNSGSPARYMIYFLHLRLRHYGLSENGDYYFQEW
jgi:hypothetical protein